MSFILDALKKSERARQKQAGPSLFEVKIAAPRRALPGWAVALGVLLTINAAVIGWVVLGRPARRAAATAARATTPEAVTVAQSGAASRPVSAPLPAQAVTSPGGVPVGPPAALDPRSQGRSAAEVPPGPGQLQLQAASPAAAGQGGSGITPATAADSAGYAPAARSRSDAHLPLYKQLESAPGDALPRLHLDLHVYDADPSKRFVMINMHRLKQGGSLPDGVKVISIRPDGVVLSYEGRRFLLPR
jgi:general secretion pathway protein B